MMGNMQNVQNEGKINVPQPLIQFVAYEAQYHCTPDIAEGSIVYYCVLV